MGNIQLVEQSIESAMLLNNFIHYTIDNFLFDESDLVSLPFLTLEDIEKQFIRAVLTEKKSDTDGTTTPYYPPDFI